MTYEYLGYGLTKETEVPNEQDNYECAEAAMEYLLAQKIAEEDVILYGNYCSCNSKQTWNKSWNCHDHLFGIFVQKGSSCHFGSTINVHLHNR